jgi:hypothetical protein
MNNPVYTLSDLDLATIMGGTQAPATPAVPSAAIQAAVQAAVHAGIQAALPGARQPVRQNVSGVVGSGTWAPVPARFGESGPRPSSSIPARFGEAGPRSKNPYPGHFFGN